MGFIYKDRIPMLKKGYPTVSDKYDVAPACIDLASANVGIGEMVAFGTETGRYAKIGTSTAVADLAGFVLATNIKVPSTYPAPVDQQIYQAGEAFNLMFKGCIAVELDFGDDTTKTIADVVEGAKVAIFLGATTTALGKLTVSGAKDTATSPVTATDIPDAYFTGVIENHGTASAPRYFAEVFFRV